MKKHALREFRDFCDMRELVEWAGEEYSDRISYSYKNKPSDRDTQKISFNRFRADVRSLTSSLVSLGVSGKHCVVIGRFSYEFALLYFSVMSAGGVLVPLDRDWHAEELYQTASKAEGTFLFADEDIKEKAEYIEQRLKLQAPCFYMNAKKQENNIKLLLARGEMKFISNPELYFGHKIDADIMSLLVFTSGTTGKGKGVMLTQRAVISDVRSAVSYIDYSQKTIGVLPPHHTYGSSVMFLAHAMIGSEIYVSGGLRHITKELREQKPGHLVLVPLFLETFYRRILATVKEKGKEQTLFNTIKLSNTLRKIGIDRRNSLFSSVRAAFGGNVKTIISGGAPINSEIISFFDSIGISVLNGYGITECAPLIAFNRSRNIVEGSVGDIIEIDTVKISNPNEDGEGEILVRGENVMLGYYKDEEATKEAIDSEGYFHTGDYGKKDGNILYITGRKKNLIILSNGKNVYPEEIENELIAVGGVLEIVVYEGKSIKGTEHNVIVAEIFPDFEYFEKNSITDIKAYLKEHVDQYNKTAVPYKKITLVKVRNEEFPKNTLRKIQRFKLDTTISE